MTQFRLPINQVFIIAEIANAHEGSPHNLLKLVKKTIQAKPDAIKFQLFKASELLVSSHPDLDIYEKLEIPDSEWIKIVKLVRSKNIKLFVDVFSLERAMFANKLGVDAFKIHSSDINNSELISYLARTGKPLLLSCSGCTVNEIDNAVNTIRKTSKSQIILMHGFQGFPTDISQINLGRIVSFRQRYNLPVGYSDHIDGASDLALYLPLVALGTGANIIEKHITLNRALKREDYQSSLNPTEFWMMAKLLRSAHQSLGTDSFEVKEDELAYRKNMKKRVVASRDLPPFHKITKSDITLRRVHFDTPEVSEKEIIGRQTKNTVAAEMPLYERYVDLKKFKVVAAIACRVDSTRLFAKPLQRIGEGTILDYLISQLRRTLLVDEIVLAISENQGNEIFVEFARQNYLKFIRGNDEDVLQRVIKAAELVNANVVLRVTSEDPYKYWQAIDNAIQQHIVSKVDFTPCTDNLPEGAGFEVVSLKALKESHKKGERKNRSELVTSYIREHLADFSVRPFNVDKDLDRPDIRLTVDYPEDLILAREIASRLLGDNKLPDLKKIITLIDNDPFVHKLHEVAVSKARKTKL